MENQNQNGYGDAQESVSSSGVGEVVGYRLTNYDLNDRGSLEIEFTKTFESGKELKLKGWINPVDAEKLTVFEGQTPEQAFAKAVSKVNRTVKALVRNFVTEEEYVAAMKGVKTFEELITKTKALLPADFNTKEGTLVVGYKANGFLAFNPQMEWDKESSRWLPFFSLTPTKMRSLGNLTTEKPEEVAQEQTAIQEVSW